MSDNQTSEHAAKRGPPRKPSRADTAAGRIAVCLVIGCCGVAAMMCVPRPDKQVQLVVQPEMQPAARPTGETLARPHLDRAERCSVEALDANLERLHAFFDEARRHTPEFAADALGFRSKWCFVVDRIPFTRHDRHAAYLHRRFEAHLFAAEDLEREIDRVVGELLAEIESIESVMLVDLQADAEHLAPEFARLDSDALRAAYAAALDHVVEQSERVDRSDIAREVLSLVAGEVLAQVVLRMGTSAAILGTGAASSWTTFGVGLIAGLLIDQLVTWIWDRTADPQGQLARDLDRRLGELQRLAIEGENDGEGLRGRLRAFLRERAEQRRAAVLALLKAETALSE